MKKYAILVTALILMPSLAFAQKVNQNSATSSGSYAGVQNNFGSSPASESMKTVPNVEPPGIYGGTNPCSVGATGGVSVLGFGISGGETTSDEACEKRNISVILYQENEHGAAIAMLCELQGVPQAMAAAGTPCPEIPKKPIYADRPPVISEKAMKVPQKQQVCKQVFVPPANANGAGYMMEDCN